MHNKLLNAVKDVESCKLAYFKPAKTISGLISDLHASLAAALPPVRPGSSALYIDRKYKYNRSRNKPRTCYVCKREGFWSSNHPTAERLKVLRQKKSFRQFMTSVQDEDTDEEDQELVEQLEDLVAHVIQVEHNDEEATEPYAMLTSIDINEKWDASWQLRKILQYHPPCKPA